MKKKRVNRVNAISMGARLQRIESKTDRVLMLLTNIYKGMSNVEESKKAYSEAVDNLFKATQNLEEARKRGNK